MSVKITATVANTALDAAIGSLVDNGKIQVYDGTRPAGPSTAVTTQVKLAEFTLAADAFPAASAGILTMNPASSGPGLANGTATWFRLIKSDLTAILDGDVSSPSPASGDFILTDPDITTADVVAILSCTITLPLAGA